MKRCSRSSLSSVSKAVALAAYVAWLVFLAPQCAQAQEEPRFQTWEGQLELPDVETPCAPEVTENRRAVVSHEGDSGLWFHSDVARCLLGRLSALPLYSRQVSLLERRLTLQNERDALQERRVALAAAEADTAAGALEAAVRGRREAEEEKDAWYRHPALWFTVGVVVTVALEAVAIWGFSQITL